MPNITQTRDRIRPSYPFRYDRSFGRVDPAQCGGQIVSPNAGFEKVNSYRSRNGVDISNPDGSAFIQTSGSQDGFMKELIADSKTIRRRERGDYGHEFWSEKTTLNYHNPRVIASCRTSPLFGYLRYEGPIWPFSGTPKPPIYTLPTANQINVDGANLIGKAIPTKAEASLATFMGELRERFPQIPAAVFRSRGLNTRSAGGEYLNYEFGVKPFINDLEKMAKSVLQANKIVKQMRRDSDKIVRRRRSLAQSSTHTTVPQSELTNMFGLAFPKNVSGYDTTSSLFTTLPELVATDTVYSNVWFAGAFSFHLSEADTFLGNMGEYEQLANQLLGTRFNASTVYELTPWSWLIDWYSNLGTFVSNVEALSSDSLVLRYGYVMHETRASRLYERVGLFSHPGGIGPSRISATYDFTRKSRTRATPYGFGVDVANMSARRWAILGALGMTKGPKNLGI